jgi:hypothetical protein
VWRRSSRYLVFFRAFRFLSFASSFARSSFETLRALPRSALKFSMPGGAKAAFSMRPLYTFEQLVQLDPERQRDNFQIPQADVSLPALDP